MPNYRRRGSLTSPRKALFLRLAERGFIPLKTASKIVGVSYTRLYDAVHRGAISFERHGIYTFVLESEAKNLYLGPVRK